MLSIARVELAVQLGHLELVLEVGDRPQALDDRGRPEFAGELDQEVGEDPHLDVGEVGGRFLDERLALLGGEQRLLLADRVVDDADDDPLEDRGGAGDDVEVAVGDRVVAARDRRRFRRDCSPSSPPSTVDGDVGGAVAALAQARRGESRRSGPRAPLSTIARPSSARRPGAGCRGPAPRGRRVYRGRRRRRDRRRPPRARCAGRQPARRRRRGPARRARRRPSRSTLPSAGAGVAVDEDARRRHRARAPRSPAPRCRRRGRARGRPRPARRAPRRSPRGRGRRSAAPSQPAWRDQLLAAQLSRDRLSCSEWYRVSGAGAEAAAGGLEQAGRARAPRASRGARSSSSTSSRASSRAGVSSGSSAAAKRGRPCWRVPRISPSPRRARSTSASLKPSLSPRDRLEPAAGQSPRRLRGRAGSSESCSPRPTRPRSWCSWETP